MGAFLATSEFQERETEKKTKKREKEAAALAQQTAADRRNKREDDKRRRIRVGASPAIASDQGRLESPNIGRRRLSI